MASMLCSPDVVKDEDEDDGNITSQKKPFGSYNEKDFETLSFFRQFQKVYPSDADLKDNLHEVHDTTATTNRLKNSEQEEPTKLSALRARRSNKQKLQRQSQEDTLQRSNVPRSSTTSLSQTRRDANEQLSRLKSACHYTLIGFLSDCPSLINNNVKGSHSTKSWNGAVDGLKKKQKFDEVTTSSPSSSVTSTLIKSTIAVDNSVRKHEEKRRRNGRTSWSFILLGLYKFLKLIATVVLMFLKLVLIIFILVFILYCLMVLHKPTQAFVSRHTQDLIYPFMRTIRFGSLKFVSRFPQLHELYEDACVLANPFFEMNDVSCWPCESVRHVIDLTGFSNFTSGYYHSGIPFIIKDAFSEKVGVQDLYKLYDSDKKHFGNVLLQSSNEEIRTLDDFMKHRIKSGNVFTGNLHVAWKINRAQYARQLRRYFSRPYYIPNSTEVSVQHFLYIDEPASKQYPLPVTEFANVFVMQADGRRFIVLVPVRHCRATCKAISVVLQPNDVLFYNWLFWRPLSFPMRAADENVGLSVTYVGSFY